jgi:hypothetical protein
MRIHAQPVHRGFYVVTKLAEYPFNMGRDAGARNWSALSLLLEKLDTLINFRLGPACSPKR